MSRQFLRVFLIGFLILLLSFGGLDLASAAKPTPTPPPGTPVPPTPRGGTTTAKALCEL
jgi:hypothetical protein